VKHPINRPLLLGAILTLVVSCSPEKEPHNFPSGTPVTLKIDGIDGQSFSLGPKSAQYFLEMVATLPIHTEISKMPALPMGIFEVSGKSYKWHGNGVIHGRGASEQFWSSAYMQALINAASSHDLLEPTEIQGMLDGLEADLSVPSTPLEAPGAYSGGSGALEPTQWREFKPKAAMGLDAE
jgi:hypothetical protein